MPRPAGRPCSAGKRNLPRCFGLLRLGRVGPECLEFQVDLSKRFGTHQLRAGVRGEDRPSPGFQAQHPQGARHRIDQPRVCHPLARVDRQLLSTIEGSGGRRQDFAHPVRGERTVRGIGHLRQPGSLPAGQIGHENVAAARAGSLTPHVVLI